jgi:anthranilate phosphoribosyltransferase
MGVYDPNLCTPLAQTLGLLGLKGALVVHGSGLDEIAIHDSTEAAYFSEGVTSRIEICPEQAGLVRRPLEQIKGEEPAANAEVMERLFKGDGRQAHIEAVAVNAGALAWVCGKAGDIKSGTESALGAIASGRCHDRLLKWAELSHGA